MFSLIRTAALCLMLIMLAGCNAKFAKTDPMDGKHGLRTADGRLMHGLVVNTEPVFYDRPSEESRKKNIDLKYLDVLVLLEQSPDGKFYKASIVDMEVDESKNMSALFKKFWKYIKSNSGWISADSVITSFDCIQGKGTNSWQPVRVILKDPERTIFHRKSEQAIDKRVLKQPFLYLYKTGVDADGQPCGFVGARVSWNSATRDYMLGWVRESDYVLWDSGVAVSLPQNYYARVNINGYRERFRTMNSMILPFKSGGTPLGTCIWITGKKRFEGWTEPYQKSPVENIAQGEFSFAPNNMVVPLERRKFDILLGMMASLSMQDPSGIDGGISAALRPHMGNNLDENLSISALIRKKCMLPAVGAPSILDFSLKEIAARLEDDDFNRKLHLTLVRKYTQLRMISEGVSGDVVWSKGREDWIIDDKKDKNWWWISPAGEKFSWIPGEFLP